MKIIAIVFGGLLGVLLMLGMWALRVLGWFCALATGLLLLLALTQIGNPVGLQQALSQALLCFAVALIVNLPTVLFSAGGPARGRVSRGPQRSGARDRRAGVR